MAWWYLSFADPKKPKGQQWLGGAYVLGRNPYRNPSPDDLKAAIDRSHAAGFNPGGTARGWPVGQHFMDKEVPEDCRNCLLSKEDMENKLGGWKRADDSVPGVDVCPCCNGRIH